MQKQLTIYPIHSGNDLDIFSSENIDCMTIRNMAGVIMMNITGKHGNHHTLDITTLPSDTYIIEVLFENRKTTRSVFVKI